MTTYPPWTPASLLLSAILVASASGCANEPPTATLAEGSALVQIQPTDAYFWRDDAGRLVAPAGPSHDYPFVPDEHGALWPFNPGTGQVFEASEGGNYFHLRDDADLPFAGYEPVLRCEIAVERERRYIHFAGYHDSSQLPLPHQIVAITVNGYTTYRVLKPSARGRTWVESGCNSGEDRARPALLVPLTDTVQVRPPAETFAPPLRVGLYRAAIENAVCGDGRCDPGEESECPGDCD